MRPGTEGAGAIDAGLPPRQHNTVAAGDPRRSPTRLWRRVRRVLRRVFGAPDYDAYLEHCRAAGHPPRLNEREYVAEFFESKGKGVRCC
jgi:uncharacterized short protein YbdD (DUF466 family)